MRRSSFAVIVLAVSLCRLGPATARADEPATLPAVECRVESEVFAGDAKEPVSRSLTLFRDGVAWDFLAPAAFADDGSVAEAEEIALHDPARGRIVLVDPKRNLKTTVESRTLERLSASLAAWAREADDDVVRWAGGPDFVDGFDEHETSIELHGPRVRYAVAFDAAPSPETAAAYRRFADTAILLKALVHPGGLPPFPRIAINDRVAAAGGIPREVVLDIDAKPIQPKLRQGGLRSAHRFHPRWIESDHDRIEAASARMSVAREVPLAEYAGRLK